MLSGSKPVNSRPRVWAAVAVVASVAVAFGAVTTAAPDRFGIGVVVAAAILWPTAPVVASLLRPGRKRNATTTDELAPEKDSTGPGHDPEAMSLGIIVRVGNEPLEVARATILLNKASGLPVVASSATTVDPALHRLGVEIVVEPSAVKAIELGARRLRTDAVMLVSGRAVFDVDALDTVRQAFGTGADWVIGEVEPLSRDELLCDPGQEVTGALRASARAAGATLWENDAIALRCSSILNAAECTAANANASTGTTGPDVARPGQSLGRWLRELQRRGLRGSAVQRRVAWRSLPADPGSYWPDSVARHRMRVRDAFGAAFHGSLRARLIALGIVAFELSIVPALLWIAAPIWVGAGGVFPFEVPHLATGGAVGAAAWLRWLGLRRATGVPLRPRADLTAAAYRLPASFSSVIGRGRPRADRTTASPLTVGALVCTVLTGWAIVSLPAAQRPTVTVTMTATMLAALWYVAVLGLSQSNWARTAFRLPVRLQATVDGVPATVINGSPGGLAVRPAPPIAGDRPFAVAIRLRDGSELPCTATVVARRGAGDDTFAGLRLSLTDQGRERWLAQLHDTLVDRGRHPIASTTDPSHPADPSDRRDHPGDGQLYAPSRTLGERVASAVVSAVAGATVLVLIAVVGGVQMSVIRSRSMVPTYDVGHVVLSRQIPAAALEVGDVAQIPSELAAIDQGETLTHRVVAVSAHGDGTVSVETRGDNNDLSERTVLYAEQPVGRVWSAVPTIGRPLLWIRQQWAATAAATAAIAVVAAFVRRRHRRRTAGM